MKQLKLMRLRVEHIYIRIKLAGVLFGRGYFSATHASHSQYTSNRYLSTTVLIIAIHYTWIEAR